jgi:2'-5' RNA ligase
VRHVPAWIKRKEIGMKTGFVLLLDHTVHNFVRRLAFELHRDYQTGFRGALLPPHISLKQPFQIADIESIEAYFDGFAASIQPFDVTFEAVEVQPAAGPAGDMGVVWVRVRESSTLRGLHARLNAELAEHFASTAADFDGPDYRFHATVVVGGQPPAVYRRIAADLRPPPLPRTCRIREIMMCYIEDDSFAPGTFITYKTLPLGAA